MLDMVGTVLPPREELGAIEYPTPAPVHLRKGDVVIHIPDIDYSVFEGDDISPLLKELAEASAQLDILPLILSSRPYLFRFDVDQSRQLFGCEELDDAISQIKGVVAGFCRQLEYHEPVYSQTRIFVSS